MLHNAQNTLITGGTFTNLITSSNNGREGLIILQKNIASGAFHNSAERFDPPKCHPQTRTAVLSGIMDWVKDTTKLFLFMWLYGPAGAGKSAIAQTIAEICHREGILAASFFFSRNVSGRNNGVFLITTLVYQLTLSIPEIRERVGKALEDDPLLLSRTLQAQADALIIKPLNDAAMDGLDLRSRPRFLIIDGLDECGESKMQRYILSVLLDTVIQLTIPLYFLLASRPSPLIRDAFNEQQLHSLTVRIVLDDSYKPDSDIRRFLESRFNDIKQKHPSRAHLPTSWPSELDIKLLIQKSSGQFIYASTVMKYLDSIRHWPPDRLDIVFGLSTAGDDNPLAELDLFYHHILSSVASIDKAVDVLTVILFVEFTKTRHTIEDFLFYRRGELDIILCDLHSLISLPIPHDEHTELHIFHGSLPDFLLDRSRSGKFFIDTAQASTKLTRFCLKHFKEPEVMGNDGINLHRLRALFMLHCVSAQPTPELLNDLYNVDMSAHLSFWASSENVFGILKHDNKRILNLLMWLGHSRHPNRDASLLHYHLTAVDDWLYSQLESYPHQFTFRLLLAAGTFTNFSTEKIFKVLGPNVNSNTGQRRHDPLQIYSLKTEYAAFYNILTHFLVDQDRSKSYFVDSAQYATLAIFVAIYLADNVGRLAKNLLAFILPKSAKTPELAKVLQNHHSRHGLHEKDFLYSEISRYLQEYDEIDLGRRVHGEDKTDLTLLVAYKRLREEKGVPSDMYTVWMNPSHDCGDSEEQGYDIVFH